MKGRAALIRREAEASIRLASWTGIFAQVAPKAHDKLVRDIIGGKKVTRAMTGREIGSVMRALAARSS